MNDQSSPPVFDMTPYLVLVIDSALAFFRRLDAGKAGGEVHQPGPYLAMKTYLYASHLQSFGAFKRFDIKRKMKLLHSGAVVLNGTAGAWWVDYSAPGNILFGYISAARGLDRKVCWAAGGLLETLDMKRVNRQFQEFWYDHPGDKAAVDLGWELFLAHPAGVNLRQTQNALTADVLARLQEPAKIPSSAPLAFSDELTAYPYPAEAFLNDGESVDIGV